MAFTSKPQDLFPTSYSVSGSGSTEALVIRRTDLGSLLDSAEIVAATGDPRKIIAGFLNRFYNWYDTLNTAGTAPTKVTVKKVSKLDSLTSESVATYTFVVRTPATTGNDLTSEP